MAPRRTTPLIISGDLKLPDGSQRPDAKVAQPKQYDLNATDPLERKHAQDIQKGAAGAMYEIPKWVMKGANGANVVDPHTDSHFHPSDYIQRRMTMKRLFKAMNNLGIRNSTLMPIPTSLRSIPPSSTTQGGLAINPQAIRAERETEGSGSAVDQSMHDHDHFCGSLDTYYVPDDIRTAVEEKNKRDNIEKYGEDAAAEMPFEMTINNFKGTEGEELLDKIISRNKLYVDTAVNSHLAGHITRALKDGDITEADLSRLDPMITGVDLGDLRAGHKMLVELAENPGIFTGIGEITVHKELVQELYADQDGQASTLPKATGNKLAGLVNLMEVAGIVGMPVVLHCDIDDLRKQMDELSATDPRVEVGKNPKHLAGLEQLFTNPRLADTKIVWAHGGGLGRFVQQGPDHLTELDKLLDKCPNLNLDISWSEVAKQITNSPPALQDKWIEFLEKNSSRICFGSDALLPKDVKDDEGKVTTSAEDTWGKTKAMYAGVLDRLTPEARANILNETYERVFVESRKEVRAFEQEVLTRQFVEDKLSGANANSPINPQVLKDAKKTAGLVQEQVVLQERPGPETPRNRPPGQWKGSDQITGIEGTTNGGVPVQRGVGNDPGKFFGSRGWFNSPGRPVVSPSDQE